MTLDTNLLILLRRVGEKLKTDIKDAGKPTPQPLLDLFKVLSILEVTLNEVHTDRAKNLITRIIND